MEFYVPFIKEVVKRLKHSWKVQISTTRGTVPESTPWAHKRTMVIEYKNHSLSGTN